MFSVGFIDDDLELAEMLADELEQDTLVTDEHSQVLEWVKEDRIGCLFTDLKMKPMDGMEVLKQVFELNDSLPVVMMTGHASIDSAVEAMKQGADDYLQKPLSGNEVQAVVNRIEKKLEERKQLEGFRESQRSLESEKYQLIGQSEKITEIRTLISELAPQSMSVLVKGETGTGKEIVARKLHAESNRSDAPLITVNCAAIPDNLLEEELFGHKKGAFTGAEETRKGKLELADGGTVFLDEIGELPINLQPKLLRVLEQGEVTKVGGDYPQIVDVRFIAATNRDVKEMMQNDNFRKDLYYRLNSLEITTPSLREHPDDIEPLVQHFLDQIVGDNSPPPECEETVIEVLKDYSWPGNVRELRNVIERASVLCSNNRITLDDLPDEIVSQKTESFDMSDDWRQFGDTLPDALDQIEQNIIHNMLDEVDGNKAEAARKLGVSRQSLQYKLQD